MDSGRTGAGLSQQRDLEPVEKFQWTHKRNHASAECSQGFI